MRLVLRRFTSLVGFPAGLVSAPDCHFEALVLLGTSGRAGSVVAVATVAVAAVVEHVFRRVDELASDAGGCSPFWRVLFGSAVDVPTPSGCSAAGSTEGAAGSELEATGAGSGDGTLTIDVPSGTS